MSASGRNDRPCTVCRGNFENCPHSHADEAQKASDDRVRKIVREELARIGKV